jgi:endonuclease/exonuclease/phosphatase family metal-dependent hydrolase
MNFAKIDIEPNVPENRFMTEPSIDAPFTVMTYNIHHGRGRDGKVDLNRICAVIDDAKPDLVALQEVDRGLTRSRWIDQGQTIADLLQMNHSAGHNWYLEEGAYGNVFLSRWPVTLFGNLNLSVPRREPRGCLLTEVHCGASTLLVGSLHLGLGWGERKKQSITVLSQLKELYSDHPILLMGDFNSLPFSYVSRQFRENYVDAARVAGDRREATYRRALLSLRLDYIYATDHLLPLHTFVMKTKLSGKASDHYPLVARFRWKRAEEREPKISEREELLPNRPV